jgi:8-oxo-dGTP diphosphatase
MSACLASSPSEGRSQKPGTETGTGRARTRTRTRAGYTPAVVPHDESTRNLIVVAAVIRDGEGRVLLARRPDDRHMGGLWEFPGGKVDDGEAPADALVRELREELGVAASIELPITFAVHEEQGLRILLLFYAAHILDGEPKGREGQAVAWVPVAELASYPTPPADADLVRRIATGEVP